MSTEQIRSLLNLLNESILVEDNISQILNSAPSGESLKKYLLGRIMSHKSNFEKGTLSSIMKSRTKFSKDNNAIIIGTQGCAYKPADDDDFTDGGAVHMFSPYATSRSRPYLGSYMVISGRVADLKQVIGDIKAVYVATNLIAKEKSDEQRFSRFKDHYSYVHTINKTILPVIVSYEHQVINNLKNKIHDLFRDGKYEEAERVSKFANYVVRLYTDFKNPNSGAAFRFMETVLKNLLMNRSMDSTGDFQGFIDQEKLSNFVMDVATGSTTNRLKVIRFIKNYLSGNQ
jgi:hypothetical protein